MPGRGTAEDALFVLNQSDEALDASLEFRGFKQNPAKKDIVPVLARHCENERLGENRSRHCCPACASLGGRYAWSGSNSVELQFRNSAITIGWLSMGRFLVDAGLWSLKRIMFLSVVVGEATSGMESYDTMVDEEQHGDQ